MQPSDAISTVAKVESTKSTTGIQDAYQQLSKDLEKYSSTHTQSETNKYWDNVTTKLRDDGVLPELAVAWAAERHLENLTKQSLDQIGKSPQTDVLSRTMASELKEQYDTLTHHTGDGRNLGAFHPPEHTITHKDISNRIESIDRHVDTRTTAQQAEVEDKANTISHALFKNNEALFDKAASQHHSADKSYITKHDLVKLQHQDEQSLEHGGQGVLTDRERRTVNALINNWSTPDLKQMETHHYDRDGREVHFGAMTRESLANAAGFETTQDMIHKANHVQSDTVSALGGGNTGGILPPERHEQSNGADTHTATHKATEAAYEAQSVKKLEQNANDPTAEVKKGEGYWHVAARLLNIDRNHASAEQNKQIANLTKALMKANDNKSLKPNEKVKLPKQLAHGESKNSSDSAQKSDATHKPPQNHEASTQQSDKVNSQKSNDHLDHGFKEPEVKNVPKELPISDKNISDVVANEKAKYHLNDQQTEDLQHAMKLSADISSPNMDKIGSMLPALARSDEGNQVTQALKDGMSKFGYQVETSWNGKTDSNGYEMWVRPPESQSFSNTNWFGATEKPQPHSQPTDAQAKHTEAPTQGNHTETAPAPSDQGKLADSGPLLHRPTADRTAETPPSHEAPQGKTADAAPTHTELVAASPENIKSLAKDVADKTGVDEQKLEKAMTLATGPFRDSVGLAKMMPEIAKDEKLADGFKTSLAKMGYDVKPSWTGSNSDHDHLVMTITKPGDNMRVVTWNNQGTAEPYTTETNLTLKGPQEDMHQGHLLTPQELAAQQHPTHAADQTIQTPPESQSGRTNNQDQAARENMIAALAHQTQLAHGTADTAAPPVDHPSTPNHQDLSSSKPTPPADSPAAHNTGDAQAVKLSDASMHHEEPPVAAKYIDNVAHAQAKAHNLSDGAEQKLKTALTLVTTNQSAELNKILPEINFNPGLKAAFASSVSQLGYKLTDDIGSTPDHLVQEKITIRQSNTQAASTFTYNLSANSAASGFNSAAPAQEKASSSPEAQATPVINVHHLELDPAVAARDQARATADAPVTPVINVHHLELDPAVAARDNARANADDVANTGVPHHNSLVLDSAVAAQDNARATADAPVTPVINVHHLELDPAVAARDNARANADDVTNTGVPHHNSLVLDSAVAAQDKARATADAPVTPVINKHHLEIDPAVAARDKARANADDVTNTGVPHHNSLVLDSAVAAQDKARANADDQAQAVINVHHLELDPAVAARDRAKGDDSPTEHIIVPSLKDQIPANPENISKLAQDEAKKLSLSPEAEHKLENAMTLITDKNNPNSMYELAAMLPNLAQADNGKLANGLQESLAQMGYKVTPSWKAGDGSASQYSLNIKQPYAFKDVAVSWAPPPDGQTDPQLGVHNWAIKGLTKQT